MEYHEAARWLFDLRRFSPRTGVEHTRQLLDHLGDPDSDLRCVQVAGSNGKGSTARMVERTLREAGLDVGLYTSPHLDDIRERVRVNGRKMPKSAVAAFVDEAEPYVTDRAAEGESPTFFETVTVMSLWEFDRQDIDVAVLEVGIGGRHDATSAVDPVASAVTSVTLEHADLLGDTEAEIARDKAAVAPDGNPLVTATTGDALEACRTVAGDVLTVGDPDAGVDVTASYDGRAGLEGTVTLAGDDWRVETRLPLLGEHQARNAGVAAALCRQVADVSTATLARGLRNAHLPGRFEVFDREPLVILDGAHNPGGCAGLADALAEFDYDDLHLVFGAMADKDHAGMAEALPRAAVAYTCRPEFDRAETAPALAAAFDGEADAVVAEESVDAALEAALAAAEPSDAVLVAGSLFTVAEARRRWTGVEIPKRLTDLDAADAALADSDVGEQEVQRLRGAGIHRVLKTSVRPRQADQLREEMLRVGGDCAVSKLSTQDREPVDVVLMGTLSQHAQLVEALTDQSGRLEQVGERLGEALDLQSDAPTYGYPWEDHTAVMGILNVTPDSFHDGGEYEAIEDAVARAETMVADGAELIDVGGESTRPGADVVAAEEEIDRVIPVVEQLADIDALISVDTRKAEVARAALDAGADILNDVSGLEDPEMRLVAAEYDVPVVVMHSIEAPVDPDTEVEYDDVVEDTIDELVERILLAEKAGLDRSQILVDPGLGFGKTKRENFELLGRVDEFRALGCPILVGHSHKSMYGLLDAGGDDRLHATVGASAIAATSGADILRVHDVAENVAAVRVAEAAANPDDI